MAAGTTNRDYIKKREVKATGVNLEVSRMLFIRVSCILLTSTIVPTSTLWLPKPLRKTCALNVWRSRPAPRQYTDTRPAAKLSSRLRLLFPPLFGGPTLRRLASARRLSSFLTSWGNVFFCGIPILPGDRLKPMLPLWLLAKMTALLWLEALPRGMKDRTKCLVGRRMQSTRKHIIVIAIFTVPQSCVTSNHRVGLNSS